MKSSAKTFGALAALLIASGCDEIFPTMNATEAVGIASHRDEQDRAYRHGD